MINPESTISFRRFRTKNSELSRLYWFHALNSEIGLLKAREIIQGQAIAPQVISGLTVKMFTLKTEEYIDVSNEMLNRTRLQLLLVCSANLESYLNDITFAYIASLGYVSSPIKLNEIGEALGRPILEVASIPKPLLYAEKLFNVDLGELRAKWINFYKLRCVVAHSGGVVTARSKRDLSQMVMPPLNDHIGITWVELSSALSSAHKIVTLIDKKLRTMEVKSAELLRELFLLKEANDLPEKKKLHRFLFDQYGIKAARRKFGDDLLDSVYHS